MAEAVTDRAEGTSDDDWETLSSNASASGDDEEIIATKKVTEHTNALEVASWAKRIRKRKRPTPRTVPTLAWKCTPGLEDTFVQELTNAHLMHLDYVDRCSARGVKPTPLKVYAFDVLCQSGWVLQKNVFTLPSSE